MSTEFDPYLKWLGVRTDERPPNHYALLGVSLFENDPEAIANAADRQMSHVRTFQSGKHSALSQQLLNELASARVCLLNPQRKAAYDASLQEAMDEVQALTEESPAEPADAWDFDLAARTQRRSPADWLPANSPGTEAAAPIFPQAEFSTEADPLDVHAPPAVSSAAVALKLRRRRHSSLPAVLFLLILLIMCLALALGLMATDNSSGLRSPLPDAAKSGGASPSSSSRTPAK